MVVYENNYYLNYLFLVINHKYLFIIEFYSQNLNFERNSTLFRTNTTFQTPCVVIAP